MTVSKFFLFALVCLSIVFASGNAIGRRKRNVYELSFSSSGGFKEMTVPAAPPVSPADHTKKNDDKHVRLSISLLSKKLKQDINYPDLQTDDEMEPPALPDLVSKMNRKMSLKERSSVPSEPKERKDDPTKGDSTKTDPSIDDFGVFDIEI